VPPENKIVPLFWSFIAIATRLRFSCIDGAGHQHGETPQYFPSLTVQQVEFEADLCSALGPFYEAIGFRVVFTLSNGEFLAMSQEPLNL